MLKDANACAEFGYLWKKLYNEKICVGCWGKMRQRFSDLMNVKPEKLKIMSKGKFVMMSGKLIDRSMAKKAPFGMYNASNITDEDALALLKASPGYLQYFKEFPDNWKELLAKGPAKTVKVKTPETSAVDEVNDRADAIDAINSVEGKFSYGMNAKDVIALLERIDSIPVIETFTEGESELEKKRKTVIKAIKKRIRQLSE